MKIMLPADFFFRTSLRFPRAVSGNLFWRVVAVFLPWLEVLTALVCSWHLGRDHPPLVSALCLIFVVMLGQAVDARTRSEFAACFGSGASGLFERRTSPLVRAGILFAASPHLTAGVPRAKNSLSVGRVILYENSDESSRTVPPLSQDVLEYGHSAKQAVSSGQLLHRDRGRARRAGAVRQRTGCLQQQLALALAQTGALDAARETLGGIAQGARGAKDEETLSLLGRVHKELWRRTDDPTKGTEALEQSCKFYGDAFAAEGVVLSGHQSRVHARCARPARGSARVREEGREILPHRNGPDAREPDGWLIATLAEALTTRARPRRPRKLLPAGRRKIFPAGGATGVDAAAGA